MSHLGDAMGRTCVWAGGESDRRPLFQRGMGAGDEGESAFADVGHTCMMRRVADQCSPVKGVVQAESPCGASFRPGAVVLVCCRFHGSFTRWFAILSSL